jgi:glutamine synthetase
MKSKLEYIWLDGYQPTQSLRSKTRVESDFGGTLEECPMWVFDGSSTEQAEGGSSDCLLEPVAIIPDPDRTNAYLVMTEVLNADGSPHESNGRATIDDDDDDFWFGFEQEYFCGMSIPTSLRDFRKMGSPRLRGLTIAPSVPKTRSEEIAWMIT